MKNARKTTAGSRRIDRRNFLKTGLTGGIVAATFPGLATAREPDPRSPLSPAIRPFELDEITIAELQTGMTAGKYTARSLAEMSHRPNQRHRPQRARAAHRY